MSESRSATQTIKLNLIKHVMNKNIFFTAFVAMTFASLLNTNAQNNSERATRRQEMQARMTENLVKELKLTDDQKAKFDPIYTNYLKELAALRQDQTQNRSEQRNQNELTDAEATAKLQEVFTHQEQQIKLSQQRLDVQKKYCAELSSVLTPQQLLRVFQPQQNRFRQGGRQGNRGERGGGFGGPRGGGFGGPAGEF